MADAINDRRNSESFIFSRWIALLKTKIVTLHVNIALFPVHHLRTIASRLYCVSPKQRTKRSSNRIFFENRSRFTTPMVVRAIHWTVSPLITSLVVYNSFKTVRIIFIICDFPIIFFNLSKKIQPVVMDDPCKWSIDSYCLWMTFTY